jgi:hypothetical protein
LRRLFLACATTLRAGAELFANSSFGGGFAQVGHEEEKNSQINQKYPLGDDI